MAVSIISLTDFLQQFDDALEWMRRHGVRINGTRLAAYRRVISRAVHEELNGRIDSKSRPELMNALVEASEIVEISQIEEQHLRRNEVIEKLQRVSGGPDAMAPQGADPARDFGFEFHTAAVLQQQGEFGGFSELDGDLTVALERYPAECKRISSLESVRNRLRDGRDKLNQLKLDGSPAGVVAIDLTRPIRLAHGPIFVASDDQFVKEAERRLVAYLPEYVMTERNIRSLRCPSVLGVIARSLSLGTVGDDANVRRSVVWQACSVHEDGSVEDKLFRRVARGFGPGDLREGSLDEIIKAVKQVEVIPNRRK